MAKINENFRLIVEYTWLVIAVVSLATSAHSAFRSGVIHRDTLSFLFMAIISLMMFLFRRNMRKRNMR